MYLHYAKYNKQYLFKLLVNFNQYEINLNLIAQTKTPPEGGGWTTQLFNYVVDLHEPGKYLSGIGFVPAGPHFHS